MVSGREWIGVESGEWAKFESGDWPIVVESGEGRGVSVWRNEGREGHPPPPTHTLRRVDRQQVGQGCSGRGEYCPAPVSRL